MFNFYSNMVPSEALINCDWRMRHSDLQIFSLTKENQKPLLFPVPYENISRKYLSTLLPTFSKDNKILFLKTEDPSSPPGPVAEVNSLCRVASCVSGQLGMSPTYHRTATSTSSFKEAKKALK